MKGTDFYADATIPELYNWFAGETVESSPTWTRLCTYIGSDSSIQPLLDALPGSKRQPNIFLGAVRFFDGPTEGGTTFDEWVNANWDKLREHILTHSTQTNEPGRCATLSPVIASLGERIALIEVGMSAGLCLFPDRYGYRWHKQDGETVTAGPTDVTVIDCQVEGGSPVPYAVPNIVWRGGIDLNPLDPANPADAKWLRSLVWPGQHEREDRLAAALSAATDEPVVRLKGDALDLLPRLVEQAPSDATVVVIHTAVVAYFSKPKRAEFRDLAMSLPIRWVSNEDPRVIPGIDVPANERPGAGPFLMALDGHPLAFTGPHGQFLRWV